MAAPLVNEGQAASPADPVAGTTAGVQTSFWVLLGAGVIAFAAALGVFVTPRRPR